MSTSLESHLKDHLLPPPSYDEVTNHQRQLASQCRVPTEVDNIIPSAPLATDLNPARQQPAKYPYQAIIITGIIVVGLVAIALIVSLTFIFVKHNPFITTTTTTTTTTATTTTTTTKRPICFDGDSVLVREDGSRVKIRDLKIGDQILVAYKTTDQGVELRSSPVLAVDIFQKLNNGSSVGYLEIQLESNLSVKPLHITPKHSLLVRKEHASQAKYLFASQVEIGDYLYLIDDGYRSTVEARVSRIKHVELFDAYAPLTLEGTLVVNDVVVSCYGTFTHSFVHLIMAPRRWSLYCALQATLSLVGLKYAKENVDFLHNYLMTINLFWLSIRNQIRDFIYLFKNY